MTSIPPKRGYFKAGTKSARVARMLAEGVSRRRIADVVGSSQDFVRAIEQRAADRAAGRPDSSARYLDRARRARETVA